MKKSVVFFVLVLGLVGALTAVPACADSVILYDDSLSFEGGTAPIYTCDYLCVSDSFTLSSNSTVTGVDFAAALYGTDIVMTSVDWSITTYPGGDALSLATASTTQVYKYQYTTSLFVFEESFSIPNMSLPAGTYYLTLGSPQGMGLDTAYWFDSCGYFGCGPSTAYFVEYSKNYVEPIPNSSQDFQILGEEGSPAPEPSSYLLLGSGLAGLAGLIKRKLMA